MFSVEVVIIAAHILAKPASVCWIKSFDDSEVEFDLRIWIDDPEACVGNIVCDVFHRIWDTFKANDTSAPNLQRDIQARGLLYDVNLKGIETRT